MVLPSFPREPGQPSKLVSGDLASAYDVARANGFAGTEANWLASLVGPPGIDGVSPTVDVGTTTTGAEGTDAIVTQSGTSSARILDFTIPRGDTGPAGTVEVYVQPTEPTATQPGALWLDSDADPGTDSPVTSVNGQVGAVVIDPDDLDDTTTANKFVSQAQLDLIAAITVPGVGAKGFIYHDTFSYTERPTGYVSVEWVGTALPFNAVDGDTWLVPMESET